MKSFLKGKLQSSGPDSLVIIPSAAYSGAIISFVLCPTELVKVREMLFMNIIFYAFLSCDFELLQCRMQVQGTDSLIPKSSTYNGPADCALQTLRTEGVRKLFCYHGIS